MEPDTSRSIPDADACLQANQTLTASAPDPVTSCTPTSGISPALVASIEGAAQCVSAGPLGRFQCQVGYNSSAAA